MGFLWQKQTKKFINSLILTTMKKSILILTMALLMLGAFQTFAQDPVITPTTLDPSCIDLNDPLRPVPGNPYTYEVNVPTPPGNKSFRWYVTQDPDFAVAGAYNFLTAEAIGGAILAAGEAHYNVLTADANTIELTWQSFILNPGDYVFVVIYVENEGTDCTTNNIKVYRIQPLHAFTLDIANIDSTNNVVAVNNLEQCVDDVISAVFDPGFGTDGGVVYDYGKNIFYYGIAAANFSGQYELTAIFNGLQVATPNGNIDQGAEIYWGYSMAGIDANGPITYSVAENNTVKSLGVIEAQDLSGTVGADGEMIYIKIIVRNNQFEAAGAAQFPYTFAINGKLVDDLGNPLAADDSFDDLHFATCLPDLYVNDVATQILVARPTVNSVNPPAPGFLPIAP